ncbi:glycosyltransferase family 2 protein [Burkholderia sp. Ac-20353]|uniref:glycosyltransferase family 2 protein n=1 Tax=Burkholderia sp. Ac-20353 TaxID=2703894 RepID=UPI00197B5836|nr:glycosyltransferase family 2 protein [Burkholderia sp. Ac-20353]MBN3789899.1 glycosyltransferase family 2 protein [Burkholderia sp. Ac-20353]
MSANHANGLAHQAVDEDRVAAVIVTYNPDPLTLGAMLDALRSQVDRIVIVDNGSQPAVAGPLAALAAQYDCVFDTLGENAGIATAQNRGIERVRRLYDDVPRERQYVLLLDHDSIPAAGMVARLVATDRQLRARGVRVGAVGPVSVDRRTGTHARFIVAGRFWLNRVPVADDGDAALRVDFLIASGTLVRGDVFDAVGGMDERLFIDHVDTEWCLRAVHRRYALFAVREAFLEHSLGDEVIPIWLGRRREVFVHSPVRDYYMCRNTLLVLRGIPMPLAWRAFLVVRMLGSVAFFGLGVAPRGVRLRRMWQGLRDGFAGRGGTRGF